MLPHAPHEQIGSLSGRIWRRLWSPVGISSLGEWIMPALGRRDGGELPGLRDIRSVVVIRPDEIGDVVLTSPLLRELRQNLPAAHIALVVKPATFNLVERCPYVDEVLAADMGLTRGGRSSLAQLRSFVRFSATHLWNRYDMAIYPRLDDDPYGGRLLTYISGASWRIGYADLSALSDQGCDRRLTHIVPRGGVRHDLERNLDVLRWLGGHGQSNDLELWTDRSDVEFAQRALSTAGDGPLIATCLGAGHARKIWPLDRYETVFRDVIEKTAAKIVVIGGKKETPLAEALAMRLGTAIVDLTAKTTLRQAGEVMRRCNLYLGNDTGPMHIAAAAGVPVVAVFCHPADGPAAHPNSPERFGPRGVAAKIVRPQHATPPCRDGCDALGPHCICAVPVEAVLSAAWEMRDVWEKGP